MKGMSGRGLACLTSVFLGVGTWIGTGTLADEPRPSVFPAILTTDGSGDTGWDIQLVAIRPKYDYRIPGYGDSPYPPRGLTYHDRVSPYPPYGDRPFSYPPPHIYPNAYTGWNKYRHYADRYPYYYPHYAGSIYARPGYAAYAGYTGLWEPPAYFGPMFVGHSTCRGCGMVGGYAACRGYPCGCP